MEENHQPPKSGSRFDPGGGTGNLGSEGLPNSDRRMSTSARPPAPLRADRRREGTQVVLDLHVERLPFKHDHETAAAAGVRDLEKAADAGNGGFEGGIPHRLQLNGRHPAPGTRHPAPGRIRLAVRRHPKGHQCRHPERLRRETTSSTVFGTTDAPRRARTRSGRLQAVIFRGTGGGSERGLPAGSRTASPRDEMSCGNRSPSSTYPAARTNRQHVANSASRSSRGGLRMTR